MSNLCGLRKMQYFLETPIGGVIIDPKPDRDSFWLTPNVLSGPMKKMSNSIKWFWHMICMKSNSQNFVDWRAI